MTTHSPEQFLEELQGGGCGLCPEAGKSRENPDSMWGCHAKGQQVWREKATRSIVRVVPSPKISGAHVRMVMGGREGVGGEKIDLCRILAMEFHFSHFPCLGMYTVDICNPLVDLTGSYCHRWEYGLCSGSPQSHKYQNCSCGQAGLGNSLPCRVIRD